MPETLYNVLNADGSCYHGGVGKWHLPCVSKDGKTRPGKWMPRITGKIEPCANGYHVFKEEMLIDWIAPAAVFEVETRGEIVWAANKGAAREARLVRRLDSWTEQAARLFACDCSEHLREKLAATEQIELDASLLTIRRYAFGMATNSELETARMRMRMRSWAWAWYAGSWARQGAPEKEWNTARLFKYLREEVDIEEIQRRVTPSAPKGA